MLRRILNASQDELLAENRRLLSELLAALTGFDAAADDLERLRRSALQLDELFLLVVAGEFNAGKSAFINALLGSRVLEEGVTPTTSRVHVLQYRPEAASEQRGEALEVTTAPVEMLREIHIVDTPGTNAIHRDHEAITREFVPRSDLVLFVTSADRPFTESERAFLAGIREWGKKVVVVINKIDILEQESEVESVRAFVAESARTLLGATPDLFPVSARQALRGKTADDAALLAASRFPALESFLVQTLDERERLRLKLLNPLGVASHVGERYREIAEGRLDLLKADVTAIDDIERQLALYREDVEREFRFRLADADNVLHAFEARGVEYLEETMRLGRVFDLLNKSRIKAEFEKQVVGDLPQVVDRRVTEVIDWLVASDLRQWQAVMDHLAKRKSEHSDRIVGQVGGSFDVDRTRLLDSVGQSAQRAIDAYDKEAEASRMAEAVQAAVASTALVEVGALGLGALVTAIATTTAADVTGILAAGFVAALGLFIIPNRRQKAKQELKARIATMRQQLMTSLTSQFERELGRGLRRIEEAIAPYTRFVRAERERLSALRGTLAALGERLAGLRARIEAV